MPTLIKIYVAAFSLVLVLNVLYGQRLKIRALHLGYEILAGVYLMGCVVAYWHPSLGGLMNAGNVPAVALIIVTDCYFSLRGDPEDLGVELPEISDVEFEVTKAVSILFAAPAYVIGSLLAWDLVGRTV